LVAGGCRLRSDPGCFGGSKTGPSPVNRRKSGSKHHLITDASGIPLACLTTAANRNDVSELLALVEAVPPVRGKRGRPRRRPRSLLGDRGYHSGAAEAWLRARKVKPVIAHQRAAHGSGLGRQRWVVERTLSWLHQHRRLRLRYERRANIHEAFVSIACSLICLRALQEAF
jgi:transposase